MARTVAYQVCAPEHGFLGSTHPARIAAYRPVIPCEQIDVVDLEAELGRASVQRRQEAIDGSLLAVRVDGCGDGHGRRPGLVAVNNWRPAPVESRFFSQRGNRTVLSLSVTPGDPPQGQHDFRAMVRTVGLASDEPVARTRSA
jgi:hypothetical protein